MYYNKRISQKSKKRKKEEVIYEGVKATKQKDLIDARQWRCLFSNIELDDVSSYGWHHVIGRDGELVYDYNNVFPALWEYHYAYHQLSVDTIIKQRWYKDFFIRLKELNLVAFKNEYRRISKTESGIKFIKEYEALGINF